MQDKGCGAELKIGGLVLDEFKDGNTAANRGRRFCNVDEGGPVSERKARKWLQRFEKGNESLEDESRSGRPFVIKDEELREYVYRNVRKRCADETAVFDESAARTSLGFHEKLDK